MRIHEFLRRYGTHSPGLIVRRVIEDLMRAGQMHPRYDTTVQMADELQRDLTHMLEAEMAELPPEEKT